MASMAEELAARYSQPIQLPVPPEPPKGGFADIIAAGFGAAPDMIGAHTKGLEARATYDLRNAQTESALAQAEQRRQEALRRAFTNDAIMRAQRDPDAPPSMADMFAFATGAGDLGQGMLRHQEYGGRSILGDLSAAPEAQFAAGQMVQGRVLPRFEDIGGQTYNLAADPSMQSPFMTPLQQAQ